MFLNFRSVFLVFLLYSLVTLSGCSSDKDTKISQLQDQISDLKDKVSDQAETIAELNKQVGEGKQQYLEEDGQKSTQILLASGGLLIISLLFAIWRERKVDAKWKEKFEQGTNELKAKNDEQSKVIMELEHTIKKLKDSLEEGERNEVATLIKTLKSERDFKMKKIGGIDADE
ncbi:hypothetical protein P8629_05530 [Hydrogenovibrio sp. 3SP14C1]|uniref:hypothetical protein n=1 Tax=Hydrogenovibrio sp. 3SP14C1 TaxID=3038774 RepID=UPI0024160D00|nr:hypothetical protein [Hydrogenovibrio sp. 3SP14C1]MDG4812462.1 hypothetical protein [Hydrogenovibrio sp. 3SP14C1]